MGQTFLLFSIILMWQAISFPTLTYVVMFLHDVPRKKKNTPNQCLFTLFLDPSQFLIDLSICQIPNVRYGLANLTCLYPTQGTSPDTVLELD